MPEDIFSGVERSSISQCCSTEQAQWFCINRFCWDDLRELIYSIFPLQTFSLIFLIQNSGTYKFWIRNFKIFVEDTLKKHLQNIMQEKFWIYRHIIVSIRPKQRYSGLGLQKGRQSADPPSSRSAAVIWPKYCRYGIKQYIINQS